MSIPHLFRCPISLDLFIDPVTLCTGQTYDRHCIEKWISSGNLTCPVTMLTLHDLSMVPNHTLRHLIRQWRNQTPSLLDSAQHHHHYMAALKQTLESSQDEEVKLHALKQVKALSLELPGGENEGFIRMGFFPLLLELAFGTRAHLELVELALTTAVKLMPYSDQRCLNVLKEEAKLECLLALLEKGTPLIKITLCRLLEDAQLSSLVRNSGDIQRSILNLIQLNQDDDDDDEEVSEKGVKLILALCKNHVSLEKLVQLGAVRAMVRYIMRGRGAGVAAAVSVLEVLVEAEGGKEAVLREEDGVRALVKMVFRVSEHQGSESAVKSLTGMCCGSEKAREEAVKAGVVTQLLLLLQSQCSGRAKTKARVLLKLLRAMWAKDPVGRN